MAKTFVIHDESLNSYGFWMMTSGADLSQFMKNPIMLWNHNRPWREEENQVLPIGHWENIRVVGTQILADAVFDTDPFSAKIAAKVESGTLRMASVGVKTIEVSEDPQYIKQGQRYETVLKFKVREASITDIGSNDNALAMYDADDKLIELSATGEKIPLKELNLNINENKMKILATLLNLAETATEQDVANAIKPIQSENVTLRADLQKEKDEKKLLQDKLDAIELADKTAKKTAFDKELELAFKDGRLTEKPVEGGDQTPVKNSMIKLFDSNPEGTMTMLKSMSAHTPASVDLSDGAKKESAFDKRKREIEENAAKKK